MGNARARGSYDERKEQAIGAGRIHTRVISSASHNDGKPLSGFLAWWRSQTWTPTPNRSYARHRAERRAARMKALKEKQKSAA